MLVVCLCCSKEFFKTLKAIKKSPRHFCNRSCAATVNNSLKPKRLKLGSCIQCGSTCRASRKHCSTACLNISKASFATRLTKQKKACLGCREVKDKTTENFYCGKRFSSYCKLCTNKRRTKTKEKCVEYKGGKCILCSYSKCLASLDFHHLDSSKKDFGIGTFLTRSFENLKEELDKCVLLCANCHREVHAGFTVIQ